MENTNRLLEDIYASEEEIRKDCIQLEKLFKEINSLKGSLKTKESVINYFKLKEQFDIKLEKIFEETFLKYSRDLTDMFYNDKMEEYLIVKDEQKELELSMISEILFNDETLLKSFDNDTNGYKQEMERMIEFFNYINSDSDILEYLEGEYSSSVVLYYNVIQSLEYILIMDSKGTIYPCNCYQDAMWHMKQDDRKERRSAFQSISYGIADKFDLLVNSYLSVLKPINNIVEIKSSYSFLETMIGLKDLETYNNIIKKLKSKLSINHKYFEVRKRILGLNDMHEYDNYISALPGYHYESLSFEEMKDTMINAVEILGETYQKDLRNALDSKWYDPIGSPTKSLISVCVNIYEKHPYVHHNSYGRLLDMQVLSHEFAHAINFNYINKNQPYYKTTNNTLILEAFAIVNELLTISYIAENEEEIEKRLVATELFVQSIHYELCCVSKYIEFQQWLLQSFDNVNNLDAEEISNKYVALAKEYQGNVFENMEEIRYLWLKDESIITMFLEYKYFIAVMIAISIIKNLKNKGQVYRDKYMEVLKLGSQHNFNKILEILEINLDSEELIDNAFEYYNYAIDKYEQNASFLRK